MNKKKRSNQTSNVPASVSNDLSDKTERKRVECGNLLLELYEKAHQLSDKQLYDYALECAVRLTDSAIGFFHLVSDDQKNIILTTWNSEALKNCTAAHDTHYPIDTAGNWVDCVRLKRPVIYNDFPNSPNQKGLPKGHSPVHRFMSIPVMEGDKVRIIFGVGNKIEKYDDHDVIQIQLVANELQKIIKQRHAEETLRKSETRYRALAEAAHDMIFVIDCEDRVQYVNTFAARLFSVTSEQVIGKSRADLFPPDIAGQQGQALRRVFDSGQPLFNESALRFGEREIWISNWLVPLCDETGVVTAVMGISRDITERKRSEMEIARMNRALHMLSDSNQALIHITDEATLLSEVCRIAVDVGGYRLAWVGFAEHDKAKTLRPVARAGFESGYIESAKVGWANNEHGRGPGGTAIRTGQPSITRNILFDPAFAPWREAAIQHGYKSIIALPLISEGQTLGALGIYSSETDAFDVKEVEILKELASDLAFGITALRTRAKRDQVEEALQDSEQKLKTIVFGSPIPQFVIDRDHRVIYWNKALEETSGIKAEEVIGTSQHWQAFYRAERPCLADLLVDEDFEAIPDWYGRKDSRSKHAANAYEVTDYFPTMGEEGKWLYFTAAVIRDTKGNVIGAVETLEDITERKRSEQALQKAHEDLKRTLRLNEAFLSAIPIPVFFKDKDGRYLGCNRAFSEFMGVTSDQMKGKTVYELWPSEYAQVYHSKDLELMRNPTRQVYEFKVIDKDGLERPVIYSKDVFRDENDQVAGLVGAFLDITERKRVERAVRASEEQLRSFIENISIGIYRTTPDGRILMANPALVNMLGYTSFEDLARRNLEQEGYEPNYDRAEFKRQIEQNDNLIGYESSWSRKDGTVFCIRENARCVRDSDHKVLFYEGVVEDITDRKRAEEEIKILSTVAEQSTEGMAIADLGGNLTFINEAWCKKHGYESSKDLLGKNLAIFHNQEQMENEVKPFNEKVIELGSYSGEVGHITRDGKPFPTLMTSTLLKDKQGKPYAMVGIAKDITERKRSELLQNAVYQISQAADNATNLDELYKSVHEIIGTVMPAKNFYIALYDKEKDLINFTYFVDEVESPPQPVKPGKGLTEYVLRTGKPLLCNEATDIELRQRGEVEVVGAPSAIWLGVPLTVENKTIGVMVVQHYTDPKAYSKHELQILEYVSSQVAKAIEHKRAEDALRESEERYRLIAENTADTIIVSDLNLNPIYISPSIFKLRGYTVQETMAQSLKQILTPVSLQKVNNTFAEQMAIEISEKANPPRTDLFEIEVYRKDDSTIWVEIAASFLRDKNSKPTGILTVIRDISERKRAEMELRRLTHAIEQSPVSVVMTNADGDIEYVNPKFTEITGYTKDEVRGKNPRVLKSGETKLEEYKQLWDTITAGKEWRGEFHNKKKNGELFWEAASISPVRDERGVITHFIAIKEDITERKRSEEELRQNEIKRQELMRELIQAQSFESLGTLASGIAHDFNNILSIILGHSALLERALTDPVKVSHSLDVIKKATLRGASLVTQLLTFARKSESVFESVSINRIINEVIKLLHETIPKTIVFSTNLKSEIPSIIADTTQMHQVLLNLCVNARDAMPKGGNLSITTTTLANEVVVSKFPRATAREYVLVSIADTGTGMNDETKQRIFDPFFTTKGPGKGTGLGLALVYSIVENHHGMIAVDSSLGKGTTFSLYFPVEEHTIESIQPTDNQLTNIHGGTETILLIEDEEMIAEIVKTVLVQKGYSVLTAYDGEEGLEIFQRHQKQIAVVLTDLGLPKFGGDEVFRRIKAIDAKARVILASGFVDAAVKLEMFEKGLKRFIQKPYSHSEVLRAIRDAIDKSE